MKKESVFDAGRYAESMICGLIRSACQYGQSRFLRAAIGIAICALGYGYVRDNTTSDLGDLYERSAQYHYEPQNAIIVILGILGVDRVNNVGALTVKAVGPGDGTALRSRALMGERVGRKWAPMLKSRDVFVC